MTHFEKSISLSNDIAVDKQVSIICSECEFLVDRDVICTGSPYFDAMFKSGMKEAVSGRVEVKQMEAETLGAILHFLHTGQMAKESMEEDLEDKLKSLFCAAHLLQVAEVELFAAQALGKRTSKENLHQRREMAITYNNDTILHGVLQFMARDIVAYEDEALFLELTVKELEDLLDITRELMLPPESSIKSILKWVHRQQEERYHLLLYLISHLRLSGLSRQFVQYTVASEPLFREHMDVTKDFMMVVLMHRIIDGVA